MLAWDAVPGYTAFVGAVPAVHQESSMKVFTVFHLDWRKEPPVKLLMGDVDTALALDGLRHADPRVVYGFAAIVTLKVDSSKCELDELEDVFRLTNNINRPWIRNDCVMVCDGRQRSTSVGDVIVAPTGGVYVVAGHGFKRICGSIDLGFKEIL